MNHTAQHVDLAFTLHGNSTIPADHGYHLYAALSRVLPALHETNGIAVHPIRGQQSGNREVILTDRSRLVLRCDTERIGQLIALAGKQLNVAGRRIRVGVPRVFTITPAPTLYSRIVTTKNGLDHVRFESELRRQLDAIGISSGVVNRGKRRTVEIKHKEIVGYEVIVDRLTDEESLALQTHGLGGRRRMGCGIFVSIPNRSVDTCLVERADGSE